MAFTNSFRVVTQDRAFLFGPADPEIIKFARARGFGTPRSQSVIPTGVPTALADISLPTRITLAFTVDGSDARQAAENGDQFETLDLDFEGPHSQQWLDCTGEGLRVCWYDSKFFTSDPTAQSVMQDFVNAIAESGAAEAVMAVST